MKKNTILFPFQIGKKNKKAFCFAMEFARKVNANLTPVTTIELPFDYLLSEQEKGKIIKQEKAKIFNYILKLKGYYHGQFYQWNKFDAPKVLPKILRGSFTPAIFNAIKCKQWLLIIVHQGIYEEISNNYNIDYIVFSNNLKIIILPEIGGYFEPMPNLDTELFQNQKTQIFEQLFMESEFYSLPQDFELFHRSIHHNN